MIHLNLKTPAAALCLVLLFFLTSLSQAQTDPALKTAVLEALDTYLETGPTQDELSDGSAIANWALLSGAGLPGFRNQRELERGSWKKIWLPVEGAVAGSRLSTIRPLQLLSIFEQTQNKPDRFVRLLGKAGVLDPKDNKQREKGKALRTALESALTKMEPIRSNSRFESGGWKYTGTVSLEPAHRLVRVAVRGSQPCVATGTARTVNLNLKGRIYEDLKSPTGIKIQLLDSTFESAGCRLTLTDRIDAVKRLSGGGEAKVSGNLNLRIRDDAVTGRFQVDLVSKQVGVALLTGRAVYTLRGGINSAGEMKVVLTPVSTSGSTVLKKLLNKEGRLTGKVVNSVGKGTLVLPVLKDSLGWSDAKSRRNLKAR